LGNCAVLSKTFEGRDGVGAPAEQQIFTWRETHTEGGREGGREREREGERERERMMRMMKRGEGDRGGQRGRGLECERHALQNDSQPRNSISLGQE